MTPPADLVADRLAVLVHEVRSPVAALSTIAEVARPDDAGLPTLVELATAACRTIERLVRDVAAASVELEDVDPGALVREVAAEVVGEDNVSEGPYHMGAEDFSYFLEKKPGAFYFLGSRNEERGLTWGHHHPRFDIDESAMAIGMDVMVRSVLRVLNEA